MRDQNSSVTFSAETLNCLEKPIPFWSNIRHIVQSVFISCEITRIRVTRLKKYDCRDHAPALLLASELTHLPMETAFGHNGGEFYKFTKQYING